MNVPNVGMKLKSKNMRTIKFRGKNLNGKWIYGDLLHNRGETFIALAGIANPIATADDFKVDPESVGQFTGLLDEHGSEIYEGILFQTDENLPFCGICEMPVRTVK